MTREDRYKHIDQHIAANVRAYREARVVSQEELAQRMAGRGFGSGQATVWKIESGQRPVRASELIALADLLEVFPPTTFPREPDATRYTSQLLRDLHNQLDKGVTPKAGYACACREARPGSGQQSCHPGRLTVMIT